ncbi:hypothetical protein CVT25_008882 [Psilocybe cyanescens]|uniref:UBA domain-containing protein n=1 Tax=Psilocybe cyanescens TaxID=93625 RepID=A0A409VRE9_PSICY|nr:hypothetical protein CVT25_008882 [Psilocybe cyanescens]
MSDSFADLWSSSAPLPPKPKPQTLSSASSSTSSSSFARQNSNSGYGVNTGSKPDLFAMLSSSGSGNSTPRYGAANGNGTGNRPSVPPSRTMTPSSSSLGPGVGLGAGAGAGIARSGSAAAGGNTGGDAFSDLFSSSNQGSSNSSNMTLAARLAMESEQRRGGGAGMGMGMGRVSPGKQSARGGGVGGSSDDAAWAGLDSLATGGSSILKATKTSSAAKHAPTAKVKVDDDADDWGLADFGAASSSRARTQTTAQSIASAAAAKERKKAAVSLWDLDDFKGGADGDGAASSAAPVRTYSPSPVTAHPPRSSKPLYLDDDDGAGGVGVASPDKDFDFGSREDLDGEKGRGLLDFDEDEDDFGLGGGRRNGNGNGDGYGQGRGHGHRGAGDDEDDILGMLSKPVEVVRARVGVENRAQHTPPPAFNASTNTSRTKPRTTTSSPPPHILGQLVEMGFSVGQAKKALGATTNGMDVQAALESLLGGGGSSSVSGDNVASAGDFIGIGEDREERGQAAPPPAAAAPRTRAPPKGQKERERERLEKQRLAAPSSSSSHPNGPSSSSSHSTLATDNIQEQADKLLAQASEIGRGVFSKASAFWKEGKERVVKAYEEREAGGGMGLAPGARPRVGGARGGAGAGGKPRWMMENEGIEDEDGEEDGFGRSRGRVNANGGGKDGFRDGWEGVEERVGGPGGEVFDEGKVDVEEEVEEVDLFSSDVPAAAKSRSKPQSQVGQQGSSSSLSSSLRGGHAATARPQPSSASISSQRTRTPIPIPTRTLVPASASSLSLALKHKTLGTEQFKLGQHAAAAESYTLALGALPEGHLLRVPLLTNRALARLKIGEYAGVIKDCEGAVEGAVGGRVFAASGGEGDNSGEYGVEDPLGPSSSAKSKAKITPPPLLHPSTLPPALLSAARTRANEGGWAHPQGVGVDLLDGYVKALKRAAEACEGRERWEEAGVWWGVLSRAGEGGGEWVDEKARKEAVRGGVRCRKMLDGDASSQAAEGKPQVKPTPKTQPQAQPRRPPVKSATVSSSSSTSAAVKALQTTNAQAEADDAAKHALKDSVDARLSAWKSGKEANIRALLASLEIVLSDGDGAGKGLGMQGLKMGMADLVSAGQVKKGYMKAIGRVHPDKVGFLSSPFFSFLSLNTSNSTLEQRMLANGVFGGLNEAWIAFQATQK